MSNQLAQFDPEKRVREGNLLRDQGTIDQQI
jgi:hypothetical protein